MRVFFYLLGMLIVNSSFGQNVGIGTTLPGAKLDINGDIITRGGTITLSSSPANDLNTTTNRFAFYTIIVPAGPGAFFISGFDGGIDGREITIYNSSDTKPLTLLHQQFSATSNQLFNTKGTDFVLEPLGFISLRYIGADNKWHLVNSFNGLETPRPFWSTYGAYSPNANIYALNTGNVGIGTPTPLYNFQVSKNFGTTSIGSNFNESENYGLNIDMLPMPFKLKYGIRCQMAAGTLGYFNNADGYGLDVETTINGGGLQLSAVRGSAKRYDVSVVGFVAGLRGESEAGAYQYNYPVGVYGSANAVNGATVAYGVYAQVSGVASAQKYAGYFNGNVFSTGSYLPSDRRLKKGIQPMSSMLNKLMQLSPSEYEYDQSVAITGNLNLPGGKQLGFIAQDVVELFPELTLNVIHPVVKDGANSGAPSPWQFTAVNYVGLIPILTKALQEQQTMINALKVEVDELKKGLNKTK